MVVPDHALDEQPQIFLPGRSQILRRRSPFIDGGKVTDLSTLLSQTAGGKPTLPSIDVTGAWPAHWKSVTGMASAICSRRHKGDRDRQICRQAMLDQIGRRRTAQYVDQRPVGVVHEQLRHDLQVRTDIGQVGRQQLGVARRR